jgi:hypothetical protein
MTQRIGPSHAEEAGASPVATSQATTTVTRRLLACGMAATPLFAVVATAQILTRDGFDLRRHVVSMLSNGHLGWIQIANFTVSGLLFLAGAVGIRQAMRPNQDLSQGFRRGGTWGPRLIGVFAVGLLAAAVFVADPMNGFPPGTRAGPPAQPTWHSAVHFTVASLAYVALLGACFVVARGFAARHRPGWAGYSAATGVVFIAATVAQAMWANQGLVNVIFFVASVVAFGWVSVLAGWLRDRAGTPLSSSRLRGAL